MAAPLHLGPAGPMASGLPALPLPREPRVPASLSGGVGQGPGTRPAGKETCELPGQPRAAWTP